MGALGGSQEGPWGPLGGLKNSEKTFVFTLFPANGAIRESLGVSLGVLVEILSIPVGTRGVPGGYLGALGAMLGGTWGGLGDLWGRLGVARGVSGVPRAAVGSPWAVVASPGGILGGWRRGKGRFPPQELSGEELDPYLKTPCILSRMRRIQSLRAFRQAALMTVWSVLFWSWVP